MLDNITRPVKDRLLNPVVSFTGGILRPNTISIISFIFALAAGWLIYEEKLAAAFALWILNRIFDGLDGVVARAQGSQSDFGGYLDIMLDFITYALIPVMFTLAFGRGELSWFSLSVMLGLFYINGASWMYLSAILEKRRAGASARGEMTSVSMPSGLVEGTETVIIFSLFFLMPNQLELLFLIMSAALVPGIIYRMAWAGKNLK